MATLDIGNIPKLQVSGKFIPWQVVTISFDGRVHGTGERPDTPPAQVTRSDSPVRHRMQTGVHARLARRQHLLDISPPVLVNLPLPIDPPPDQITHNRFKRKLLLKLHHTPFSSFHLFTITYSLNGVGSGKRDRMIRLLRSPKENEGIAAHVPSPSD